MAGKNKNMEEQAPKAELRDPGNLVEVNNLKKYFDITRGIFSKTLGTTKAVDDVSFHIKRGETLGLVGESGCGKTTIGRCLVRAYPITDGEIIYKGRNKDVVDLAKLNNRELQPYRQDMRMIFQDPYSSINPRMTIFEVVSEVLRVNKLFPRDEMKDMVGNMLRRVGLRPEYMQRYPHAFSGGERQRIVIARALITNPSLIVCDEAVSALDVSIRAQILNLLESLRTELDLTYLFISHDLSVIRHVCDRIVVMYVGKVVEVAEASELYLKPMHPYTEALLSAVPIATPIGREDRKRIQLTGEIADPSNTPSGCYFHPRCKYAQERCKVEEPPLRDFGNGHSVACHFAEELELFSRVSTVVGEAL
jgi:peptide/nickel transport system ATP-binding protein